MERTAKTRAIVFNNPHNPTGRLFDRDELGAVAAVAVARDLIVIADEVRWVDIEKDKRLETAHPLLAEAIRHVAHYQIRNRGTVGGSIAHADPAAEMPGTRAA